MRMLETIKEREWTHDGLRCVVLFIGQSHRCGYVEIPPNHPWHKKDYMDVDASVHGGLTFGGHGAAGHDLLDTEVLWFGFDCAHAGDLLLGSINLTSGVFGRSDYFWNLDEVIEETEELADQVAGTK